MSFKSFSASVAKAQAGSTTIPSSFKYSKIVEHTLFSGQATTSIFSSFAILNVLSQTLATLAPSTNISILFNFVFSHFSKDFFIEAAHSGSAQIILVFLLKAFFALIIQEITHHQPIGQIIKSGSSFKSSNISKPIVACQIIILSSSNGCTKVDLFSFSNSLLALNASSKVSQTKITSIYCHQNCFVLYIFCSGVVTGIKIVHFIFS
ncbi:MAG: hypothetical protein LBU14_05805 [Candidatus Peribacteria bacterium]|nr:hypothetical protein [Candidatus Peribacteria bacterium]